MRGSNPTFQLQLSLCRACRTEGSRDCALPRNTGIFHNTIPNQLFLQRCTPVHSLSSLELGGWSSRYGIEPSSASMKKQPLHPRWGKNPCSGSTNPRRFFFFTSNVKQRILYSYIVAGWHSFVNLYFCTLTKERTNLKLDTLAWYPQTQRCVLWYPT